jgi:hypothetical protein
MNVTIDKISSISLENGGNGELFASLSGLYQFMGEILQYYRSIYSVYLIFIAFIQTACRTIKFTNQIKFAAG